MNSQLTIKDASGNEMKTDIILYLKNKNLNKNHLLYSNGETTPDGLSLIYISNCAEGLEIALPMDDKEYEMLKTFLRDIRDNKVNDNFEILSFNDKKLTVNGVRGLSLNEELVQKLKKQQPIVFDLLDSSVENGLEQNQDNIPSLENISAFTPSDTINEEIQSSSTSLNEESLVNAFNSTVPEDNLSVETESTPSFEEVAISFDTNEGENDLTKIPDQVTLEPSLKKDEELSDDLKLEEIKSENLEYKKKKIVTRDEALEALRVLNEYFALTNELPSDLVSYASESKSEQEKNENEVTPEIESETLEEEPNDELVNQDVKEQTQVTNEPNDVNPYTINDNQSVAGLGPSSLEMNLTSPKQAA